MTMTIEDYEKMIVEYIDRRSQDIISYFQKMVRCKSYTGQEKEIGDLLMEEMKKWGLSQVENKEKEAGHPNIVGRLEGEEDGPTLYFNGHLDVLPEGRIEAWRVPPFSGEIIDGSLWGRGSVDMKGGTFGSFLAGAILETLHVPIRGKVIFTGVCDEQICGERGIRYLLDCGVIQKEKEGDMGINCEPTNLTHVVIANKGVLRADVTFIGKTAHGARPWLGVNAIEHANRFMSKILELNQVLAKEKHPLLSPPHVLLAMIEGGQATNVVPDHCKVTITKRMLPGDSYQRSIQDYQDIIDAMKEEDPSVNGILHIWEEYRPPVAIPRDSKVIAYVNRAYQRVCGREVGFRGGEGGTDAAHVVHRTGIPMIVFGPGDVSLCGAPNEHVPVEDLIHAVKVYALTILYSLGRGPEEAPCGGQEKREQV